MVHHLAEHLFKPGSFFFIGVLVLMNQRASQQIHQWRSLLMDLLLTELSNNLAERFCLHMFLYGDSVSMITDEGNAVEWQRSAPPCY